MIYDIVVIGAGPAGYTAALYSVRYGRKTLLIKGQEPGGSVTKAWTVENYPGFKEINGFDLADKMEDHAVSAGIDVDESEVKSLNHSGQCFTVQTSHDKYQAKAVILATGTHRRHLGLPKEDELTGKGISYCATCDGPLFRNKSVAVVGGGDASIKAIMTLDKYVKELYFIVRQEQLRAELANVEHLKQTKATVLCGTTVEELIEEDSRLIGIRLSKPYQDRKLLPVNGLFVEIGGVANAGLAEALNIDRDKKGYIKVDRSMATNIPGFFAAGDVTDAFGDFKQIVTAAATGAVASHSAHNYLNENMISCSPS